MQNTDVNTIIPHTIATTTPSPPTSLELNGFVSKSIRYEFILYSYFAFETSSVTLLKSSSESKSDFSNFLKLSLLTSNILAVTSILSFKPSFVYLQYTSDFPTLFSSFRNVIKV